MVDYFISKKDNNYFIDKESNDYFIYKMNQSTFNNTLDLQSVFIQENNQNETESTNQNN